MKITIKKAPTGNQPVLRAERENILEHLKPVLQALNAVKVIDNESSKNNQTKSCGKVVNKNKKGKNL